jgi:hypothetical protein
MRKNKTGNNRNPRLRLHLGVLLGALMAAGGCDLPTGVEDARERLSRGKDRSFLLRLPFPAARVNVAEEVARVSGSLVVDQESEDLTVFYSAEPAVISLDEHFRLAALDMEPAHHQFDVQFGPVQVPGVSEGLALDVPDIDDHFTGAAGPFLVDLPGASAALGLANTAGGGTVSLPMDLRDSYHYLFVADGRLDVTLQAGQSASVSGAYVELLGAALEVIAISTHSANVAAGSSATLSLPIGYRSLPAQMLVRIGFSASTGNGLASDLNVQAVFEDVRVTEGQGVDASIVAPVALDIVVHPTPSGRFSSLTLAEGAMEVRGLTSGDLVFQDGPGFDHDLSGRVLGGPDASGLRIQGSLVAPSGSSRVNLTSGASGQMSLRGMKLAAATVNYLNEALSVSLPFSSQSAGLRGIVDMGIENGSLILEVTNALPVPAQIHLRFAGVTRWGMPLVQQYTVDASSVTAVPVDMSNTMVDVASLGATMDVLFNSGMVGLTAEQLDAGLSASGNMAVSLRSLRFVPAEADITIPAVVLPLAGEDDMLFRVQYADVAGGAVTAETWSQFHNPVPLRLVVEGAVRANGSPVSQDVTLGFGQQRVSIDLTGARIIPSALSATIRPAFTSDTVALDLQAMREGFSVRPGVSDIQLERVVLNPYDVFALTIDDSIELGSAIDLSAIRDLAAEVELRGLKLVFALDNATSTQFAIDSLVVGLYDERGPVRGNGGAPVTMAVGERTGFTVAPGASREVEAEAGTFITHLVRGMAEGRSMRIGLAARAQLGGAGLELARQDEVRIGFGVRARFDVTLPGQGIEIRRTLIATLDLDEDETGRIDDLSEVLHALALTLDVGNRVPLGLQASVAIAPAPADTAGFDPFAATGAFIVDGLDVRPAAVANGRASAVTTSRSEVVVPVDRLGVFKSRDVAVGIRFRLLPPADGNVLISRSDYMEFRAAAAVHLIVPAPVNR